VKGPCAARSRVSRPIGAAASVASTPVVTERTNISWNDTRSTMESTAEVETTSMIEKHSAASNAADHATASWTSPRPSAANATPATVAAANRFVTLNAALMGACRCANMSTVSPAAAANARAERADEEEPHREDRLGRR